MKYALSVVGIVAFFVVGLVCFGQQLVGWDVLSWFGSSICVALALTFKRQAKEQQAFEDSALDRQRKRYEESNRVSPGTDLDAATTPTGARRLNRIRRVPRSSGGYYYYDDDGCDITDLFIAGLIYYEMFMDCDYVDGPFVEPVPMPEDVVMDPEVPDPEVVTHQEASPEPEPEPEYVAPSETIAPESKSESYESPDSFGTGYEEPEREKYNDPSDSISSL